MKKHGGRRVNRMRVGASREHIQARILPELNDWLDALADVHGICKADALERVIERDMLRAKRRQERKMQNADNPSNSCGLAP